MMVFFPAGFIQFGKSFDNFLFGCPRLRNRFRNPFAAFFNSTFDNFGYVRHLVDAHEGVHFGQEFGQFIAETLGEAAGDDEALAAVFGVADLGGFEDGVHAFFLGGINERAGVDDEGVGLGGVVGDLDAVFQERAEHDLGVHEVFRATEGNQAHAERAFAGAGGLARRRFFIG